MKLRYIAGRLVKTVMVVIAVVLLSFFLIRLAPGDAATVMAGQSGYADEAFMKSLRAEYGLDQPVPVQLWKYVRAVAQGDLGNSFVRRQPVLDVILERLPNTLLLDAFALLVAAAGGIWLGSLAARRPDSAGDASVTVLSMLFYAMPQFWLGMMAMLVFSVWLAWLPPFGIETMGADYTGLARIADIAIRENILVPQAAYGYWLAAGQGNDLVIFAQDGSTELARFTLPRQPKENGECIADFFRDVDDAERDVIALQVVTVGQKASDFARAWFEDNRYQDYLYLHGLSVEMAEAMAEYVHKRIRAELGFAGEDDRDMEKMLSQGYRGSRYSFGYPACPRLEDQAPILGLLGAERLGISLSEEFQLHPEQSTSAIVVLNPAAKYFSV